ncbi:MAG: glycosyltransferase family 1 protein [Planctomycetota bacterium]|nr:MAG: glycosyltransferase family 1 protein [Planctomycetota bacterium]
MIGLRVIQVLDHLRVSAAASAAINMMRWLSAHDHQVMLISGTGERERDIESEGFEYRRYSQGGAGWWFGGRKRLIQDIEAWKPDLLHVQQLECLGLFLSVAGKLQLPVVVSLARFPDTREVELLRDPQVAMLIAPSDSARAHLCGRLGFHRDTVTVVPHGLDLKRYPDVPPPSQVQTVGAIGRFEARFGFEHLLSALALCNDAGVHLNATLVGSGEGAGRLSESVERLRLSQQVSIVPGASKTSSILSRLDVLVYPGLEDLLTLGVLKAMACARPVVASAVGSMTEWIHDGENGILVPPANPQALAEALLSLHRNPEKVTRLGAAAREQVRRHNDLRMVGRAMHECYRAALRTDSSQVGTEVIRAYRRLTSAQVDALPEDRR